MLITVILSLYFRIFNDYVANEKRWKYCPIFLTSRHT